MGTRLCLIATDAISFNVLYQGQLEYLRQAGLDLTLICGGGEEELSRLRRREVGRVIDLGFVRPPSPLRDALGLLRLIIHLLVHRYDIVVSTTPKAILLGSLASWLACQRNRVAFFQGRVYENATGLARWFYKGLDRVAIVLTKQALFVSNSLLSAYEAEGLIPAGRGAVIGDGSVNGVDVDRFCVSRYSDVEINETRRVLGIGQAQLVALTVGRVCRDKGLGEIIELAGVFSGADVVFIVVGSVEPGYETSASELFSLPNVRHVPFTTDVPRYFAVADVHLFLSHREGFGNVAVEAASCGVPTIAFDVVGVKDSVADGVSGIRVAPGDVSAVRFVLEDALRDRHAFRKRFSGARVWVQTRYAREGVWHSFLAFFTGRGFAK